MEGRQAGDAKADADRPGEASRLCRGGGMYPSSPFCASSFESLTVACSRRGDGTRPDGPLVSVRQTHQLLHLNVEGRIADRCNH